MRIFSYVMIALLALLPLTATADDLPLLYSRNDISIVRKNPPAAAPMPWQGKEGTPENPAIVLNAEIRDATALYNQKGWFNLNTPSENGGVLMMFTAPTIMPISYMAQYAPVDIALVDKEGKITQIIPNITLSQLEQDIVPESPVLAFLFLKGGICEKLSIAPGDMVEYKLFKKSPTVIGEPPVEPAK